MKYYIRTFGCQMNKSDSERVASVLESINYQPACQDEEADLIIVNVCSVRQKAVDRVYGLLPKFKKLKTKNHKIHPVKSSPLRQSFSEASKAGAKQFNGVKILLTGCILEKDKQKFMQNQVVDLIFNIKDLKKLPSLLQTLNSKYDMINDYFQIQPKYQSSFSAFVPISTGCNNFCSYCVVPYVRGPEIFRPAEEIINEIKHLVKNDYKEIILLGQNVNSYGIIQNTTNNSRSTANNRAFVNLLKKINAIPGDFWFSFITNHPKDMSDDLIKTLPKLEKLCHYIHLPIQSGNNYILKKMNRCYAVGKYVALVKKLRKVLPDVTISTDIIVGFPEETENQFLDTKKLMEKVKFDMAYISQYSPRSQTAAYKLKDNVSREEKKQREKILTEILKETASKNNQKYIGKIIPILVKEKNKKKKNYFYGEIKQIKNVEFESSQNFIGQFIKVKITKANPWGLKGKLI
jgi:tRNA-2-methylthio-N6-dimethylallyladenosine synthase